MSVPPSSNPWGNPVVQESPTGESAAEASIRFRLQEIQRKEMELNIRESKLNEREDKLDDVIKRAPNWPPFRPILYHDIQKEIPERGRMLVKKLYFTWMITAWTYFFNCIACFTCLVTKEPSGGSTFGMSFLIMLIGIPMSWSFWYRQLFFGVNFFAHLAGIGILFVGIPGWGGAGVILSIERLSNNLVSGIFCAVGAAFLGFVWLFSFWQLKNTVQYYRSRGMTLQQAQGQAIHTVAQSELGQHAAKQAAHEVLVSQRQSRT